MQSCRGTAFGRNAAFVAIFLSLSACYDEEDPVIPSTSPAAVTPDESAHWLGVGDKRAPEEFLATEAGVPVPVIAAQLDLLSAHYRESPRMIANRVLQLWQEYPDIPLDRLMADFVPGQDVSDRSLGPVAQHYRTLRAGGASHPDAVAAVMEISE